MISMKTGLVAAVLLAGATAQTVKLQESGQARVGNVAPSFGGWDLAGKSVLTFDKLLKTPCNIGLPRMVALQKKHPEMRLVLVDVEPDAAAAQEFAKKRGMEGPALLDKFETIARSYGLHENGKLDLPRTFLVDAKGRVRAIYRQEGDDLEAVIEADLAALPAPGAPAAPPAPAAR